MQMSAQDEGVGEEPECMVYCHSWQRHAPAPETPSRHEAGTVWGSGGCLSLVHVVRASWGQIHGGL